MASVLLDSDNELNILRQAPADPVTITAPATTESTTPAFTETLGSHVKTNNVLYNVFVDWRQPTATYDPTFNYLDPKYKGYENSIAGARNADEAQRIIDRQREREAAHQTIAQSSTLANLGAGLISGTFDLPTLLLAPLAPEYLIGKTFMSTALASGAAFAGAQTASEVALHSLQPERTVGESAANIAMAGATGVLPGAGVAVKNFLIDSAAKGAVARVLGPELTAGLNAEAHANLVAGVKANLLAEGTAEIAPKTAGSLGAAAVKEATLADEAVRGSWAMKPDILGDAVLSPNESLAKTPFAFMRELKQRLAVDPFLRAKNFLGVPQAQDVETAINRQLGQLIGSYAEQRAALEAKFTNTRPSGAVLNAEFARMGLPVDAAAVAANPKTFTTPYNFRRLVAGALRNGDQSAIPEVQELAVWVRQNIKDPLGKAALERGMLDDVIEAAGKKAEQHHVLNSQTAKLLEVAKLKHDEHVLAHQTSPNKAGAARVKASKEGIKGLEERLLAEAKAKGDAARLDVRNLKSPTSDSYLHRIWNKDAVKANEQGLRQVLAKHFAGLENPQQAVDDVITKLLNQSKPIGFNQLDLIGVAGPLKERLLMIPDNELAPWLMNDLDTIVRKYTNDLVTDIAFKDEFGDKNLTVDLERATSLFNKQKRTEVEAMTAAGKTQAEIDKHIQNLNDRFNADVENIKFLRDTITGDGEALKPLTSSWKKYIGLIDLGGMAISNLNDLGRLIGVNGFSRYASMIAHYTTSPAFRKLSREQAKEIGVGFELVLNTRMQELGDYVAHEAHAGQGPVAKALGAGFDALADAFGKVSGMAYLATFTKDIAATLNANRLARAVASFEKLGANDKAWLAQHYISADNVAEIAAQVAAHGVERDGFMFANLDKWTNAAAKQAFENATWKAVGHSVISPHAGTLPKFMRTNIGGVLTQFQSFTVAVHEQMVVAGVGQRDMLVLQGLLGTLFMGSVSVQLKSMVKTGTFESDPRTLALNTWDTTGIGGQIFGRAKPFIAEKVGIPQDRQFRNIPPKLSSLLGPTGTVADSTLTAAYDLVHGNLKNRDIHTARTLIPYQNLWYLRWLTDKAEAKAKEKFGGQ